MDGLNSVWSLIGVFFDALPGELVMVASFGLVGAVIIGLMEWLK